MGLIFTLSFLLFLENNKYPIEGHCLNTRAIINKNPLNIRSSSVNKWVGELPRKHDVEFEEFSSFEYGFRAAYILITNYNKLYGDNSIERIIYRFSPPSENRTENIISFLSREVDVDRRKPLSKNEYIKLIKVMAQIESGCKFNGDYIIKAINNYHNEHQK